jgi:tRNA pseudouridine38-40 synthase
VQDEVEKALKRLQWQGAHILAAGRTDTGVHATGQVIAFDLDWRHPLEELRQALNAYLPWDIVAREVRPVNRHFDPRRHAESRHYRYHIFCEDVRNPLRERYAWRVWPAVEVDLLQQAASALTGRHDYRAFGTPPQANGSTVRAVQQASWQPEVSGLVFDVIADAFLYHMVRHMVALQTAVGHGKVDPHSLVDYLDPPSGSQVYVQGMAPAQGLCLVNVKYPPEKIRLE